MARPFVPLPSSIEPISSTTKCFENGYPTQFFLLKWQQLTKLGLGGLANVDIPSPTDGQVLTYSAAQGKWIAS